MSSLKWIYARQNQSARLDTALSNFISLIHKIILFMISYPEFIMLLVLFVHFQLLIKDDRWTCNQWYTLIFENVKPKQMNYFFVKNVD